jgi:uncharacterized membrane protein YraQ (UPF0718 family)
MNSTAVIINLIALVGIGIALVKNKHKAVKSLKIAGKTFLRILPMTLIIVVVIGLLLGFISSDQISQFIGNQSGPFGVVLIGIAGAVMHIPALLAFPLGASLLENGASITAVAAFLTTLTMIGMITLPLEIKELGKKMALLRNGFSFVAALVIAFLMGMLL